MSRPDTQDLAAFVAVARLGSFTAAADSLGVDKARISRQVTRLEQGLGTQLLIRSTRALALTETGRTLLSRASAILEALDETEAIAASARGTPSGTLRLTCGEEFGVFVVSQWMAAFLKRHHAVSIDADLTNRVTDLIHEGFDLAVRIAPLPDSRLVATQLGSIRYALCASPAYLAKRGGPKTPTDLNNHALIRSGADRAHMLQLVSEDGQAMIAGQTVLSVNNNAVARHAAIEGLGVAMLPIFQAREAIGDGRLSIVLDGWSRPPVSVNIVRAESRHQQPKVRAFIDIAKDMFERTVNAPVEG